MSDSWRDSEGQVIDGRFPLVKHLGGSDHSVVFATHRGNDNSKKAAIKFIQADGANADAQLARWKLVAQLSHPNLIKIFECGRCQLAGLDLLYVVMDFAQENLAEFLPQRALSAEETRDMLEPFVDALSYLHGKGFAHGRVQPGNILAIDDQLKLSSDSICRDGDSQIGAGKPEIYVAPENNGKTTTAGDSWSLGATIVESLTQRRPEESADDPAVSDSLPQPFLDIARNTLRRDPKARWTVAEISNRLNPKAQPEPAKPAAVVGPPQPSAPAATKPASAAIPGGVAVAEPPKPSPSKSAGTTAAAASASAATAVAVAPSPVEPKPVPLAQPEKRIDPLAVPLSTVAPKFDAGGSSSKGWYIAILLLIAFAAGAWYAVPQLREFAQGIGSSSPSTQPSAQPASSAPSSRPTSQPKTEAAPPPANATPDTTPAPKHSAPAPTHSHGGIDGPPQVSSNQPPVDASPTSTPASERTPVKPANENAAASSAAKTSDALRASSIAPLPAISRTAAVAPTSLPAGPVTQGAPLNQVMPEVSERARSTIHGTVRVIVKVRVSTLGKVETAIPASSPSRFFGDAAVQAAKKWDFTPAKISGQPVPSDWLVRFDFTPTDTKVLPSQTKP